jgi:hypothetical protein
VALSRFRETPRQAVIELNAEGTDYRWLGDVAEEAYRGSWEVLRTVLLGASGRLTQAEIMAECEPKKGRSSDRQVVCPSCGPFSVLHSPFAGAGRLFRFFADR